MYSLLAGRCVLNGRSLQCDGQAHSIRVQCAASGWTCLCRHREYLPRSLRSLLCHPCGHRLFCSLRFRLPLFCRLHHPFLRDDRERWTRTIYWTKPNKLNPSIPNQKSLWFSFFIIFLFTLVQDVPFQRRYELYTVWRLIHWSTAINPGGIRRWLLPGG